MTTKSFLKHLFCLAVCLCVLATFPSCKKREVKTALRLINVQTQTVEQKQLEPFIQSIGSLSPNEEVMISAEVEGTIKNVFVDEGSIVARGALLAAIDDTDYLLELKRAKAALRQAEATFANTKLEYNRKDSLQKEDLITKQQYEDVQTRLALTEADVERAKAALSLAEQKVLKTKLRAPLACSIKEKRISTGDFVKNGTLLFALIQSNPLKLHFTVPETNIAVLKKGQDVVFTVDTFPDRKFRGKISIIYPNLDDKTRTLKVEALVPNGEGVLKPGLFARITIYTAAARETTMVPITSLLYESDKVRLFVVREGVAHEREVRVGNKYGEDMEIIEGVKPGETLVVTGQQNLSEGARIKIQETKPADSKAPVTKG